MEWSIIVKPFERKEATPKGRFLDLVGNNVVIKTPNGFDS
jgi:hypothetical protein